MDLPAVRATLHRWLFRVSGPEPAPIQLGQRRIFVLPTRFGLALALTLLVMLLASINYTLSLGFALTFLIGSVAWISIHHAFRNLVGLSISAGRRPRRCSAAPRHASASSSPTRPCAPARACAWPKWWCRGHPARRTLRLGSLQQRSHGHPRGHPPPRLARSCPA
jgi:hypothetical protein